MLKYLKKDPTLGLLMFSTYDYRIQAFCKSDWAAYPDSRKFVTCFIVLLGSSPISWKSKKQETISLSSAEAEYRSIRKVVGELVWLSRLFEELTIPYTGLFSVHCDSQSALQIVKNPVFHERTKHIEIDCHFVRAKFQQSLVSLHHIGTGDQLADILTKVLTGLESNILQF
ncbi:hypothetical protein AABB24_038752 [Solanum stoloniferum]|uniref:Uncharacterized protein n=1 Tax=Solanum stoloniferum TaxID=62892 RepID=A0ABD2R1I7_9SOLN